jgi:hypothetical protein
VNLLQKKKEEGQKHGQKGLFVTERTRTVMSRLATINNVLPFPPTINAPEDIMKLLHPELLQCPLEDSLRLPHSKLLLHLLKEVRSVEPQNLLQIPRSAPLLHNPGLPAVRSIQMLHPHLTRQGRVNTNTPFGSGRGGGKRTGRRSWRWRQGRGRKMVVLPKTEETQGHS